MNTYILFPAILCVLSSCSLSDWPNSQLTPISSETIIRTNNGIPSEISDTLIQAYQEELLAHDIYTYMVDRYPELTEVQNIIESEKTHFEQVNNLLKVRGITPPASGYGIYTETYTTLKNMIDSSLTGAIEVGVMVETGDIDHLLAEYQKIPDTDVRQVFENIGGASYNHLRGFLTLARIYDYTVTTDWKKYITKEESTSSGSLKYKMTELLQANNLPTSGVTNGQGGGHGPGRMNH